MMTKCVHWEPDLLLVLRAEESRICRMGQKHAQSHACCTQDSLLAMRCPHVWQYLLKARTRRKGTSTS